MMRTINLNSPKTLRWLLLINLAVIAIALSLPRTVFADDCLQDPLNAADCMRTGGYRQVLVITFSTLPTISVIIPNLLQAPVNVLPPILQTQLGPSVQPPENLPATPQTSGPPVNDKGQVWYQPPWDQGGPYWVDRSEYDSIQQHLRDGYQWSDRWGWKPPEEIQKLDSDRERRWKKFTSCEEGQRRHEQLKRDIQRDLANDPEYQRIQQKLAEIQAKLDDMKRRSIQQDIDYYQRQAAYFEQRAETYDTLSKVAGTVKTVADTSIEILGAAPGPGRAIKHTYFFLSKTGEVTAKTGSVVKGLGAGVVEGGKSYLGDKNLGTVGEYTLEFGASATQKAIESGDISKSLQEGLKSITKKAVGDYIKTNLKIEGMDPNLDLSNITHQQIMNNPYLQQQMLDKFSQELGAKLSVDQLETVLKQVMSSP